MHVVKPPAWPKPAALPPPAPATAPTAEPPPPVPAPAPGALGYREIWSRAPNGGWGHASVFTPSGDLASVSGDTLTIHARHDGSELESKVICGAEGPRALTVLRGNLYIACNEEVVEVTLPGLASRAVVSGVLQGSGRLFREAAFGGDKVVYAHDDGSVEVYSTKTWAKVDSRKLADVTFSPDVAVSADGKRVAVTNGDADTVLLLTGKSQQPLAGLREVIAFSPDGSRAFGSSGSFRAGDVAVAGGAVRELMETGSWLTAAIYFGADRLAVAGSDGIHVKDLKSGEIQQLVDMTAETLAVSADGALVCGADRGDKIACFGLGTIAPSTYRRSP